MYRLALDRPVSTWLATAALAAVGVVSLVRLPLSLLPEVERPRIVIHARDSDVSRDEMLQRFTQPVERRLLSVPSVTSIESETQDGDATITIEAAWRANADDIRMDVERRLQGAIAFQPALLEVESDTGDASPIVQVAVTGGASASARSAFAEKTLLPELARLDGAGRVEVTGSTPLRVVVTPRARDLAARGVTAADIAARLETIGRATSAGRVREGSTVRPMVVVEPVRSVDQLASVLLQSPGGLVPLRDVADVRLEEIAERGSFRYGAPAGGPARMQAAVLVSVYRAPGANAVALARSVRARIADLSNAASTRVVIVNDRSEEVVRAIGELGFAALGGILLGTLVLRFMLGRWKPTLALTVVIPASLLVALTAFYAAGIPLDVISLSGLALATGLVIDNSIVILESIETMRARGSRQPVIEGTARIARAVMTSTIAVTIVFLPLLYVRGLARAFFGEQAFSVVAALAASLLFCFSLTPVLARRDAAAIVPRSPGLGFFLRLLDRALARPAAAFAIAAAVVLLGVPTAVAMRAELFPRADSAVVRLTYRLPPDASPEEARRLQQKIEEAVSSSGIRSMASTLFAESARNSRRADADGTIDIEFADVASAERELRRRVVIPGVAIAIAPRPSAFLESVGAGERNIEIIATAKDEPGSARLMTRVTAALAGAKVIEPWRPRRIAEARWDAARLAESGIDRASAEAQLRAAVGGTDHGEVDISGTEPAIRLGETEIGDPAALPLRAVRNGVASTVPLSSLAELRHASSSPVVFHLNGRAAKVVLVDRRGTDLPSLAKTVAKVRTGEGESVRIGGEALELRQSFREVVLALLLAVLLMFLAIAAAYESLLLPIVVMATVPVAVAGAAVALFGTGQSLNLMSLVALLLLAGIAVNHTVVLVDRIEQLRREGIDELNAVRDAARERYRPVIMTTATAVLGMLPLAVLPGAGVELRRAIAVTVIGGLALSTVATLVLIPTLHAVVERFRRRRAVEETPSASVATEPEYAG